MGSAGKDIMNHSSTQSMPFLDHVEELRDRCMRCLIVFAGGFALCYLGITPWLMDILRRPLFEFLPVDQQKLYFTHLFESFMTYLEISAWGSLLLFSPYYLYQGWAFAAPALYEREKKLVVSFFCLGCVFFGGGVIFAYEVLFPIGFRYFIHFGTAADVPLLTLKAYYATCLKLMLLFGIAFELPVLVILLGYLQVISAAWLRKNRKNAIIAIAVLSAIMAPPDAISMLLLMLPLIFMFEGSIAFIVWLEKRRLR